MTSDINWRNDSITRRYIKEHPEMLGDLTEIEASDLGGAATYCKDWNNPFVTEILKRSGHLKEWKAACNDTERRRILNKSCAHHGFLLF